MSTPDESTRLRRTDRHVEATIDGETVLMDVETGSFFVLKDTAYRIWELTAEGAQLGDVVDKLLLEYDVDRETCLSDTFDLVRELVDREIVVLESARP